MKTRKFLRAAKRSTRRNVPAASRKLADRISRTPPTPLQIVSSMYAYLMTSWEELPDENKRALGFDFVVGSEGEEKALNHLARLFMDYADLSFRRALLARRRRLGMDD
jgi:hypothetical protein